MSDGNRDVDEDNNFAIGTVCFVRTEDLPVWPAVVIDGNPGGGESTPVSYRKVELFNEAKDVLTLHVNALTDFLKNLRNERDSDKSADARFSKACDDAECHVRALFMSSLQHMHPTTAPVADDEGLSRCLSRGNSRRLKGENVPIESFQVAQVSAKVESVLDTVLNVVQPLLAGMNDLHGRFQNIETVMGQKLARDEPILASMNDLKGRFHKIESSMGQMFAQVEHEDKKFVIGMQGMANKIDEVHAQVTSPDNAAAAGERVQMSKSLGALTNKIDEVHAQLTSPGSVVAANDRDQMSKSLGAIHSTLKKMAVSSEAQQKAATAAVIKQIPELKDTIAGVQKELKKRNKLEKKGVTSDEFDK